MKMTRCLLIVGAVVFAILVFQALAQTSYSANWLQTGRNFFLQNLEHSCFLSRSNIVSAPSWRISEQLPLTISNAVTIARNELSRLTANEPMWEVTEIALRSVSATQSSNWYFQISFEPRIQERNYVPKVSYPDQFIVLIDLAGRIGPIVQKPLGITNSTERLSDRRL